MESATIDGGFFALLLAIVVGGILNAISKAKEKAARQATRQATPPLVASRRQAPQPAETPAETQVAATEPKAEDSMPNWAELAVPAWRRNSPDQGKALMRRIAWELSPEGQGMFREAEFEQQDRSFLAHPPESHVDITDDSEILTEDEAEYFGLR